MDLNKILETLEKELEQNPEKSFIIKSLMMLFCIVATRMFLGGFFIFVVSFFYIYYLGYLWVHTNKGVWGIITDHISLTPAPTASTTDKIKETAWATWGLIVANSFIFFFLQTPENENFIYNNLVFVPYDPDIFNVPISFISSVYLHSSYMHLFGNMCFLWATGTIVERRVGWKDFLFMYHLSGFGGGLLSYIIHFGFMDHEVHGLGASGAISGIMGVYIIRCYFKEMNLPIPAFGILPINFNLRLNAFVVIGLYFVFDMRGGFRQLLGISKSNTGYWAHLGGMITGLWLARWMKLSEPAVEERHRDLGSSVMDGRTVNSEAYDSVGGFAAARKSLMIALEKDPDNPETLQAMARIESFLQPTDEGRDYYRKAISSSLKIQTAKEAASVFREYFARYCELTYPEEQYQIAAEIYKGGDIDFAARILEMLAVDETASKEIRQRSLFLAAKLLEKMELNEPALHYYRKYVELYPDSLQARLANDRSNELLRC